MSEYYLLGENRPIADVSNASQVRSIVVSGTIYVYWRHSTVVGDDNTAVIMMSSSTDQITWTAPVTVYDPSALDPQLGGITHNGTNFYIAIGEKNTTNGAVTNKVLSSANGTSFGSAVTVTFTENWACVSDLFWSGGTFYLAATVRVGPTGPLIGLVKTSTNLSSWTSLGYPSQVNPDRDNVYPRITLWGTQVHLVMREGSYAAFGENDQILHAMYDGQWRFTRVVVLGTGNPDVVTLAEGLGIIYQDQSIAVGTGIWSWMFYDSEDFVRRGTFSQGFIGGAGGDAIVYGDGFSVAYAQRPDNMAAAGALYFRVFDSVIDEPLNTFRGKQRQRQPQDALGLDNFAVEISNGSVWVSLTDHQKFYMSAEDFGDKAQVLRRVTAQSPYYEGTYLVHAVRENVTEALTIHVLGVSQNHVTENLLLLEELVSQPSFRIRLWMGDHVETWSCQSADYTIQRGHIMMHNTRAMMRLQVPRLPAVSYEVN